MEYPHSLILIITINQQQSREYGIGIKIAKSMGQNREYTNRPTHYGQLTVDKGTRYLEEGKNSLLNKWCWNSWLSIKEEIKFDYYSSLTKLIQDRS